MTPLSTWLREIAEAHCRAEIARVIGVHVQTIHRWLAGIRVPGPAHSQALASALGVDPEEMRERVREQVIADAIERWKKT